MIYLINHEDVNYMNILIKYIIMKLQKHISDKIGQSESWQCM
jgi:hypothetical protein